MFFVSPLKKLWLVDVSPCIIKVCVVFGDVNWPSSDALLPPKKLLYQTNLGVDLDRPSHSESPVPFRLVAILIRGLGKFKNRKEEREPA